LVGSAHGASADLHLPFDCPSWAFQHPFNRTHHGMVSARSQPGQKVPLSTVIGTVSVLVLQVCHWSERMSDPPLLVSGTLQLLGSCRPMATQLSQGKYISPWLLQIPLWHYCVMHSVHSHNDTQCAVTIVLSHVVKQLLRD